MAIRQVTRAGVGLVVGIIILGLLVFGGLWLMRERGEQARRTEAINIANEQLKAESEREVAIDTDKDEESEQSNNAPTTTEAATPAPSAAAELPQTGPEAISFIGIGLLSFAALSFVRSRKQLFNQ
ncbi:MAG: hypothetical protein JWO54_58 [Candidatus Saccharibacteria bacterium]|nr:hypothetical protein [Candidatus Saccharibacteria bacterium]MDB5180300.1 hypothetical protein [Candidatus Saccharibacteria bacterium]